MVKENWLDNIGYNDIVKLVKKRCPNAENITVLLTGKPNGEKRFDVAYTHNWQGKEYNLRMSITEYGEMLSLDPRGGESFFKIARKKNAGRVINGETFEQAYIRTYTEAIRNERDSLIEKAKKEKNFDDQFNKIYDAEKLYNTRIEHVAKFIQRHQIEMNSAIEPSNI